MGVVVYEYAIMVVDSWHGNATICYLSSTSVGGLRFIVIAIILYT